MTKRISDVERATYSIRHRWFNADTGNGSEVIRGVDQVVLEPSGRHIEAVARSGEKDVLYESKSGFDVEYDLGSRTITIT